MLIFDPVARLKLVTTWIYLTYLMYKYKYTYLHTHPPNFNSYTYSCMHMGKQLFNFYLYIDIYLQACLYMYLHTLTYVTCKHLTVIEHYLSSAMSLVIYEVFDIWRWRDKVNQSCTYRKETQYAQGLPKALFCYIHMYVYSIKGLQNFSLHPLLFGLSSTTWKWRICYSQAHVSKTICILWVCLPFLPQHSP